MEQLLARYSIEEIIMFIILLGFAIKELFTLADWFHEKLRKRFSKEDEHEEIKKQLNEIQTYLESSITDFNESIKAQGEAQDKMQETINLLIVSDKDDIKAWITEKHHYFVYDLGYIDDYNLDCMEKRFKHYQDENGNSFAGDLMNEVRSLPKVSQINNKKDEQ